MNKSRPPYWALKFFEWYCDPRLKESILGDLEEQFEEDLQTQSSLRARARFSWTVIRFFRKGIINPTSKRQKLNYYGMFKHNLLITFRGFLRHRTTFLINLLGLTASLSCILFIALWVQDELMKDRFHADSERLFQVYSRFYDTDNTTVWHGVSGLLESEIENQIPQAESSAVSTDVHEYTLSVENQRFKVKGRFGDEDYLKILNYPLLKGDASSLADPSAILITKSLAKRLFGHEDVIGESIGWHFWEMEKSFRIAGILENVTSDTSEPFEFIMPWTFYHDGLISFKGWGNYYGRLLVKLRHESEKKLVEDKINEILQSNIDNDKVELFLTGYSDQYLYGHYEDGKQAGGRIEYVYLAIAVAAFILLIACINFINLSTAFASLKIKEIGVKKSFGASKTQLAFQFFFEALSLALVATLLALLLVVLLLEPFNQLTAKELVLSLQFETLLVGLALIPLIGILAGAYPALYLSGLEVISALKARKNAGNRKGSWSRMSLVFVQFTLSIMLMVGTLVVSQQMDYALNKNLGYDRDNLLYFLREGAILENSDAFLTELEKIPEVQIASKTGFSIIPGYQNRTASISWEGKEKDQQVSFWENNGDAKSTEIIGLELVKGRTFTDQLKTEAESIIFNEKAIEIMGLENPVGQMVTHHTGKKKIIGVVKNFTTESLHQPDEPAMFFYKPDGAHYIMIKIEKGKELQAIGKIESVYKRFNPNYPFEPSFVDQDYQAMYQAEMRIADFSKLFSVLAIMISCMGLFGLTIFQVRRRIKEIGIKKVLGADSLKLAISMTYDITKSVILSLFVALPASYFLGSKWLQGFADSIDMSWWLLGTAASAALAIAWLTVGFQTVRAANQNPVEALRDE